MQQFKYAIAFKQIHDSIFWYSTIKEILKLFN